MPLITGLHSHVSMLLASRFVGVLDARPLFAFCFSAPPKHIKIILCNKHPAQIHKSWALKSNFLEKVVFFIDAHIYIKCQLLQGHVFFSKRTSQCQPEGSKPERASTHSVKASKPAGETCWSLNHRAGWVDRDLKEHLVPTSWHGQGHLPLDQVALSPRGSPHQSEAGSAAAPRGICLSWFYPVAWRASLHFSSLALGTSEPHDSRLDIVFSNVSPLFWLEVTITRIRFLTDIFLRKWAWKGVSRSTSIHIKYSTAFLGVPCWTHGLDTVGSPVSVNVSEERSFPEHHRSFLCILLQRYNLPLDMASGSQNRLTLMGRRCPLIKLIN